MRLDLWAVADFLPARCVWRKLKGDAGRGPENDVRSLLCAVRETARALAGWREHSQDMAKPFTYSLRKSGRNVQWSDLRALHVFDDDDDEAGP